MNRGLIQQAYIEVAPRQPRYQEFESQINFACKGKVTHIKCA